MFNMFKKIKTASTILRSDSTDALVRNIVEAYEPDPSYTLFNDIIIDMVLTRIIEDLLSSGSIDAEEQVLSYTHTNSFNGVDVETVFTATFQFTASNAIASSIIWSMQEGQPYDRHAQHFEVSNVTVSHIKHVASGSLMVEDVRLRNNSTFTYRGRDAHVDIEQKMSLYNQYQEYDRCTSLIHGLSEILGLDPHDIQSLGNSMAISSFVTTCTMSSLYLFDVPTCTFKYRYSVDATYDDLKSMDYDTFKTNRNRLSVLMDESEYGKLQNRMKLLHGGSDKDE